MHCSTIEIYPLHRNAYFLTFLSLRLLSAGLRIVGMTQSQYHPFEAFFENQPLTNRKTRPSNLHLGSVSNTPPSISWAPNEDALILRSRPTSFFFCASRCHQSREQELGERICHFPCLACCCIRKQRIYLAFSFFLPKQSCPKLESDQ